MIHLLNNRQTTEKRILTHVIFWIAYLLFFVFQYTFYYKNYEVWQWSFSLSVTIWPDILAAYFINYYLFPKYLFKRKYVQFSIEFIASAVLFVLFQRVLIYYIDYPFIFPEEAKELIFWDFNPFYTIINIYSVVAVFTAIKLFKYYFQAQKQKDDLEKQNRTSELALLKSQVNPHFLFNTLNNIDSLVTTDQEKASDAIIKLSDIMRYMLYDAATDKVLLQKEINYLQSYISLQELRFAKKDIVGFNIKGTCSNFRIAPMLFIPFVENAFKHGKKNNPGAIEISLNCAEDKLTFQVVNQYDVKIISQKDRTKGIGLSNVKRRLDLLYPGKHKMEISDKDGKYKVNLQIQPK